MKKNSRIYVAGHRGLIGSAFVRRLAADGYKNLLVRDRKSLDLTDSIEVRSFFEQKRPEIVVLAAGRVGGILDNKEHPADFISQNLSIQLNILQSAYSTGVKRLIFFGSSCMYPKDCEQPMPEQALMSGKPEPTSLSYAVAKLAGVQMCLAYNQQYNDKCFIPVIPNSAYGHNDNFDPKAGHVLSALIHRFHNAKQAKAERVTLWGSGKPRREFVHVDDIVEACIWLLNHDIANLELPVNIGVGQDYSIKELAELIARIVGYKGQIEWDSSKPDGAPRKLLDSRRIRSYGWKPVTKLEDGLRDTYEWYVENIAGAELR